MSEKVVTKLQKSKEENPRSFSKGTLEILEETLDFRNCANPKDKTSETIEKYI